METSGGASGWLTEQLSLAFSEVFTRAITLIIISTIPCYALSWDASAAPESGEPASVDSGAGGKGWGWGEVLPGNSSHWREAGAFGVSVLAFVDRFMITKYKKIYIYIHKHAKAKLFKMFV